MHVASSGARLLPRFRQALHVSERKVLLAIGDVALLGLALLAILTIRPELQFATQSVWMRIVWFGLLAASWLLVGPLGGVYDLRIAARLPGAAMRTAGAVLVADVAYMAIPYLTPHLLRSRLTLVAFLLLTVGLVATWRALYAVVLVQPSFRHPVLILGAGVQGRQILEAMRSFGGTEYLPVGFLDDDPAKQDTEIDGVRVLGGRADLERTVAQTGASEVVVALPTSEEPGGVLFQTLVDCHERGIAVTPMYRLFEALTGQVAVEHAGHNLYIVLPIDRSSLVLYEMMKRMADIAMGCAGLLAMAVVYPFVAVAVWLDDRGPVLYRQARVGHGGREFWVVKFRTMAPDAEAGGPRWAAAADTRVTRIGRILRRLHLDELPQAINVLRGEMSVVGPRPERPEFVRGLREKIPFYRTRLSVRPGVTGWAQVNFGYGRSVGDAMMKLRYDLYYIKHRSLLLDLTILIRTLGHVLRRGGR
jgi:exopolysaccharide biosynthesis polyprenyl glycosylphosphotransferase